MSRAGKSQPGKSQRGKSQRGKSQRGISRRGCFSWLLLLVVGVVAVAGVGIWLLRDQGPRGLGRINRIQTWFANPAARADWQITGGERCGDALMLLPTTGYIGVGYGDGMAPAYEHSGYDIFSPDGADNVTPIFSTYDGYLTRAATWRSAVIIRHPDFPAVSNRNGDVLVAAGEQIWTYYTHMASADGELSFIEPAFPRGTSEQFVPAGTLLGYQGTWSGDPGRRMGLHLHLSIVTSERDGSNRNETSIKNTLDPLPFLGLTELPDGTIVCAGTG